MLAIDLEKILSGHVALAVFSDGGVQDVTAQARCKVSRQRVAKMNADGMVTAVSEGTAVVLAKYKGRKARAELTVTAEATGDGGGGAGIASLVFPPGDVRYTPTTYTIAYKDSTNLDFKDGQIHKNYNGWIENLNRDIRGNLMAM